MSKDRKYVLALDHGTSGIKAALASVYGEVVDFVFEETPLYLFEGGGAEQNPDEWWDAIIKASTTLIDKELVPVDDIVAINCSSQWSGTVAVDSNGDHLMNAVIWMDSRGAKHLKKVFSGLFKVSGYPIKDILRFLRKTGGAPGLAGKDPLAHILYIKNELPEIYDKTYKFLECKDYLNLRFTGKFAATYDSITLHWLTDNRNVNNVKYDDWIFKRFKLDRKKFPDLYPATTVLGKVKKEVADEIGINPSVDVVMGAPDLHSAVVGAGTVENYQGHVYIGTSSWIICHVPKKKTDIFHNIASVPSAIPGRYFVANEQESAGACLTYLRDNVFRDEILPNGEKFYQNPEVYSYFDELVEKAPAGSNNLIFTPWLYGERTPIEDHEVRGGFANLSLNNTKEDLVRAVFEGVAYNSRWELVYIEKFAKRRLDPLNIIGGGARSDVWCQIYADVLNRTIRKVKNPIQANARGVAFLAGVTLGYLKVDEIPKYIKIERTFKPQSNNIKIYNKLFKEFLNIYNNNKAMFKRLNKANNY